MCALTLMLKQQLELPSTTRIQAFYLGLSFCSRNSASITTLIGTMVHYLALWKTCSSQSFNERPLHEVTEKISAAFITSPFACPEFPLPSTNLTASGQPVPSPKLTNLVAYTLHRTITTLHLKMPALLRSRQSITKYQHINTPRRWLSR